MFVPNLFSVGLYTITQTIEMVGKCFSRDKLKSNIDLSPYLITQSRAEGDREACSVGLLLTKSGRILRVYVKRDAP